MFMSIMFSLVYFDKKRGGLAIMDVMLNNKSKNDNNIICRPNVATLLLG